MPIRPDILKIAARLPRGSEIRRALLHTLAKDFGSQEALDAYLKEHPKADPKNHTVTESGAGGGKGEGDDGKDTSKGNFSDDDLKELGQILDDSGGPLLGAKSPVWGIYEHIEEHKALPPGGERGIKNVIHKLRKNNPGDLDKERKEHLADTLEKALNLPTTEEKTPSDWEGLKKFNDDDFIAKWKKLRGDDDKSLKTLREYTAISEALLGPSRGDERQVYDWVQDQLAKTEKSTAQILKALRKDPDWVEDHAQATIDKAEAAIEKEIGPGDDKAKDDGKKAAMLLRHDVLKIAARLPQGNATRRALLHMLTEK